MGNLVAATARAVQVGHRDQPLHLQEHAALGRVPREGHLCPWGCFGPRLAKLWWWGRLDQTPPKTPSTTTPLAALGPCNGARPSSWSCRAKVALEPRRATGALWGIQQVVPQGLLQM